MRSKLTSLFLLSLFTISAAACGGSESVSNNGIGDEPPIDNPTPTPEPTAEPTPILYTIRVTLTNIHVYENSDPFGNGEVYFSFAVQDAIRYSERISVGDNADINPADYGLTPIDMEVVEGDELYIYVDGYDDDQPQNNEPLGTVNTGWYAGDAMLGQHSIAADNPYRYDITYRIDWAE